MNRLVPAISLFVLLLGFGCIPDPVQQSPRSAYTAKPVVLAICPHCGAKNNIAGASKDQLVQCGNCEKVFNPTQLPQEAQVELAKPGVLAVCPHCGAKNYIGSIQQDKSAQCGNCKKVFNPTPLPQEAQVELAKAPEPPEAPPEPQPTPKPKEVSVPKPKESPPPSLFTKPQPTKPSRSANLKWYDGGTLHRAKLRDWYAASYEDRVATCGDFVASWLKDSGQQWRIKNIDQLLPAAVALEAGITEAGADRLTDDQDVSAMAVLLAMILKENKVGLFQYFF